MVRLTASVSSRFKTGKNPWIILIVMRNNFETPLALHQKFDLKGSTRNRWCTPEEQATTSVLKDLNFKSKKQPTLLSALATQL